MFGMGAMDEPETSVTILHDGVAATAGRARVAGDDLWLPVDGLLSASGWELKPEGMCQGEVCVPLPPKRKDGIVQKAGSSTWVSLTEFARLIEQPVARDERARVWSFGPPGWSWKSRTSSGAAPELVASDLTGEEHSLRELLGKKVFLLFWASW